MSKIQNELRKDIIEMLYNSGSGHPGSSLSCVEIILGIYKNFDFEHDKFVLSKGHAAPTLYAVLSRYNKIDRNILNTLRKYNSILEGHPSIKINGVDIGTGSLGQGLSISNGICLGKKMNKDKGYVYCVLGDGELEEGQIWEALMTINKYNLDNLIFIIDNNNLQIDGDILTVKGLNNIKRKIESFGINCIEIDGHNLNKIVNTIKYIKEEKKPTCIIAKTIKGKGVSFMENNISWHGKKLDEETYNKAMNELNRGEL